MIRQSGCAAVRDLVVSVEDRDIFGGLIHENAVFRGRIIEKRLITVEMIWCDIKADSDVGRNCLIVSS